MIDLNHCNEWQHRCSETGLVLPWYTKPFLDELVTWDLKDKVVLEIGMGASTLWWQRKVEYLTAFETNVDWYNAVIMKMESKPGDEYLVDTVATIENILMEKYDIAIIDIDPVEMRDGCIALALNHLVPSGRLIIDNWDQKSVWVPSDETRALLAPYPCKIYKQEGHPDWQTAVFTKMVQPIPSFVPGAVVPRGIVGESDRKEIIITTDGTVTVADQHPNKNI